MRIKTTKSTFASAVSRVSKAIGGGLASEIAVYGCVLIEGEEGGNRVKLTGTNSVDLISTYIACDVSEPSTMAIPAKLLNKFLSATPEGALEITYDSKALKVEIKSDVGRANITCVEPDKYYMPYEDENVTSLAISSVDLREILRKTSYAAATDDARKVIQNTLFALRSDGLTAVATNGRILVKVDLSRDMECSIDGDIQILLPPTTCSLLADKTILGGDGVVRIEVPTANHTYAKFVCGDTVLYSRLYDAPFPSYDKVIPADSETPATIERHRLIDAIERASIFSPSGESGYVSLTFADGSLHIESQKSDTGNSNEAIPIVYIGQKIRVLVAKNYIMPVLKAMADDKIAIHLVSESNPLMVKCSIPFLAVIMPIRDSSPSGDAS